MDRDTVIAKLQEHQIELQALGVAHASVFGSTARGDNTPASDIDVAVKLDPARALYGLDGFGRLMEIEARLVTILQKPVDVVAEPARKERLQAEIEKDRAVAF